MSEDQAPHRLNKKGQPYDPKTGRLLPLPPEQRKPKPLKNNPDFQPARNDKGQLMPGHGCQGAPAPKVKPGPVELHPTMAYRDARGRILPGANIGGRGYVPACRYELNQALLEAVTKEEIQTLGRELYALCMNPAIEIKERKELMDMFFNRFLGKPVKEVILQQEKLTTNVSLDLTRLTTDELQTFLALQSKLEPTIHVLESKPTVIDVTPVGDDA